METIKSREKKINEGPFWVTNVPEEKKANLRRFLGNLKVHLKTKSAPMFIHVRKLFTVFLTIIFKNGI